MVMMEFKDATFEFFP